MIWGAVHLSKQSKHAHTPAATPAAAWLSTAQGTAAAGQQVQAQTIALAVPSNKHDVRGSSHCAQGEEGLPSKDTCRRRRQQRLLSLASSRMSQLAQGTFTAPKPTSSSSYRSSPGGLPACSHNTHQQVEEFELPSPRTVCFFVLVSYFFVTAGVAYDIINEPPAIGARQDPVTGGQCVFVCVSGAGGSRQTGVSLLRGQHAGQQESVRERN